MAAISDPGPNTTLPARAPTRLPRPQRAQLVSHHQLLDESERRLSAAASSGRADEALVASRLAQLRAHEVRQALDQLQKHQRVLVQSALPSRSTRPQLVSGRYDKVKELRGRPFVSNRHQLREGPGISRIAGLRRPAGARFPRGWRRARRPSACRARCRPSRRSGSRRSARPPRSPGWAPGG